MPSQTQKQSVIKADSFAGAYYATSMLVMQKVWYRDKKTVPFHFFNDNKGYLQVDKFGHAFGAYFESYIGYHWLRKSGVSKSKALAYGATLGFILQSPIEIMDGIHEGWGFSWGDMAANTLGSGWVIGQELLFDEQLIKYKFSYWESKYSKVANGYLGETTLERMLEDYNGHTYWFCMPLNRIIKHSGIPRWIDIAVGYSANGMFGEFENIKHFNGVDIPKSDRYRQVLLSLDIDWAQIEPGSELLRTVLKAMTFIKLPFSALEINSKREIRFHLIYY